MSWQHSGWVPVGYRISSVFSGICKRTGFQSRLWVSWIPQLVIKIKLPLDSFVVLWGRFGESLETWFLRSDFGFILRISILRYKVLSSKWSLQNPKSNKSTKIIPHQQRGHMDYFKSYQNPWLRYGIKVFVLRLQICLRGVYYNLSTSFLRFEKMVLFWEVCKSTFLMDPIFNHFQNSNSNFKV